MAADRPKTVRSSEQSIYDFGDDKARDDLEKGNALGYLRLLIEYAQGLNAAVPKPVTLFGGKFLVSSDTTVDHRKICDQLAGVAKANSNLATEDVIEKYNAMVDAFIKIWNDKLKANDMNFLQFVNSINKKPGGHNFYRSIGFFLQHVREWDRNVGCVYRKPIFIIKPLCHEK